MHQGPLNSSAATKTDGVYSPVSTGGMGQRKEQVAQLWLTDRATAYVRKLHCAVVSTASVQVEMP